MKKQVDGKPTEAHLFEYTTQLSVDPNDGNPKLVEPNRNGGRVRPRLNSNELVLKLF